MDYIVDGLQLLTDFQLMDFQLMDYIVDGLQLLIDFQLMDFKLMDFLLIDLTECPSVVTNKLLANFVLFTWLMPFVAGNEP